jgi:hypothetical protein
MTLSQLSVIGEEWISQEKKDRVSGLRRGNFISKHTKA